MAQEINSLLSEFGIENHVHFEAGVNNFPKAILKFNVGETVNQAEIYLHGSHLTSWINQGNQKMFLSDTALFEKRKSIRGGIPIIFPQFGPGVLQQHGFARMLPFVVKSSKSNSQSVEISFELTSSSETKDMWNNDFSLQVTFRLFDGRIEIDSNVKNLNEKEEFSCQLVLHTYFLNFVYEIANCNHIIIKSNLLKTQNSADVQVSGLKHLSYIDKVQNNTKKTEDREYLVFQEEVDRIYIDVPEEISIIEKDTKLTINSEFLDAVCWNPWIEKAAQMGDFDNEDYKRMCCVESGTIDKKIILKPGENKLNKLVYF